MGQAAAGEDHAISGNCDAAAVASVAGVAAIGREQEVTAISTIAAVAAGASGIDAVSIRAVNVVGGAAKVEAYSGAPPPLPPFPPSPVELLEPLPPFEPDWVKFAPTVPEAGVMLVVSELTSRVVSLPIAAAPVDTSPVQVVVPLELTHWANAAVGNSGTVSNVRQVEASAAVATDDTADPRPR
jgi:hypothetical protein